MTSAHLFAVICLWGLWVILVGLAFAASKLICESWRRSTASLFVRFTEAKLSLYWDHIDNVWRVSNRNGVEVAWDKNWRIAMEKGLDTCQPH